MASIINRLLAVADGPDELVDLLLTRADAKHHQDEVSFRGTPSSAVALSMLKHGGASKAIAVARRHPDPEVLAVAAKDSRITVRRAALVNPRTPVEAKTAIVRAALRKGVKANEHDGDTLQLATHHLGHRIILGLLAEEVGEGPLPHALTDLVPQADDELEAFLTCGYERLQLNALRVLAVGNRAGMSVPEAIALGPLDDIKAAEVLWRSGATITPELAEVLLAGLQYGPAYWVQSYGNVTVTPEAAPALMATGEPYLQATAVSTGMTDELLALLLANPTVEGIGTACRAVTTEAHATALVPTIVMMRLRFRALSAGSRYGSAQYRRASIGRRADHLIDANGLLQRGLVHGKAALALLRSGAHDITRMWLQGSYATQPEPGQISALLTRPGWSLTDWYGPRANAATTDAQALLHAVEGRPWAAELYEAMPQMAGHVGAGHSGTPGALGHLSERLYAAFGTTDELWTVFETQYASYPGTLEHLIMVCLVSCGFDAPQGPSPGPQLDVEALDAGRLF